MHLCSHLSPCLLSRSCNGTSQAPQLMHSGGALPPSLSTVVFSVAAASAALASTVNLIASTAAFVRK